MRKTYSLELLLICTLGMAFHPAIAAEKPNVVLLLADDLGYTDIGAFGSEVATPNIDKLADQGVRFSNYHTAASCAPTRAMLMTGVDSHRAGVANMPESIPAEQQSAPGYAGELGKNVLTIAERLKSNGYSTYMTGKWHLGKTKNALPSARGFDRTFILADTGADNWRQQPYIPAYSKANWFENGLPTNLPEDFYSSKTFVDKTISYIEADQSRGKPFFAYVAFQAVHIPVQAPKEFTDNYLETYQAGWEVLRKQRYQGAIEKGIVPAGLNLETMSTTEDWDALTEEERAYEAKNMAVYAGMIEAMDFHIGRLISYLESSGQLENTIFIFASDNGAEPTDLLTVKDQPLAVAYFEWWLKQNNYSTDIETLGEPGSYNMIGPSFASAAVAPLSYYKFFSGEGGMRVPMIISGIETDRRGEVDPGFTYVTDIVPTILELTGTKPGKNPTNLPLEGHSLTPLLKGTAARVREEDDVVGYELGGNAALFKGDYKLIRNRGPVGDNEWHLFNIKLDPSESNDLREQEPERFAQMKADYATYEREYQVLPVADNYDQRKQVLVNGLRKRADRYFVPGILIFTALIILLTIVIRRLRQTP